MTRRVHGYKLGVVARREGRTGNLRQRACAGVERKGRDVGAIEVRCVDELCGGIHGHGNGLKVVGERLSRDRRQGTAGAECVCGYASALIGDIDESRGDFQGQSRRCDCTGCSSQPTGRIRSAHRGSAAQALAVIGDVLLEEGDLAGAYKMYQQASAIEHEIGRRILYASTLTEVGRVLRQQGKANEAQQAYRESLSLEEELGNKSDAAETRLALAELDCDSGKGSEAEQLSRAAVETFRADAYTDEESLAQSMVSRALLQQGKLEEARSAMTEAVRLS